MSDAGRDAAPKRGLVGGVVDKLVTGAIAAVIASAGAYLSTASIAIASQGRLFFTEVQNHAASADGRYLNVITVINASTHDFGELTVQLHPTGAPGESRIEECFYDGDGYRRHTPVPDCKAIPFVDGKFDVPLTKLVHWAKFTMVVRSQQTFETGGSIGAARNAPYGISIIVDGEEAPLKKLDRRYISPFTQGQYGAVLVLVFFLASIISILLYLWICRRYGAAIKALVRPRAPTGGHHA